MSFGRYLLSRDTRKLASLEESVNSMASFIGNKYGHLPFDKASCEILSCLNSVKIFDNEFTIERDKEYAGFYNNYIVHEKYFTEDFVDRVIATMPSESCKEFKLARLKKRL